jgi:apolipoprotein N-acyltransferase
VTSGRPTLTPAATPPSGRGLPRLPAHRHHPPLPRSPALAALLAAASGATLVLAFPPHGLWPLAIPATAGLALAVRGRTLRRATWLAALTGAAFFLPLLHWSAIYVGPVPWLLLALAQAALFAPLGAALAAAQRLPAWPLWAAAAWVADEALRSRAPFGGFPWGRLAFAQADGAYTPYAALGGAPLLTFTVALVGCLLTHAATADRHRHRLVTATAALAVTLGGLALRPTLPTGDPDPHDPVVAVIQGNVPRLGLDFNAQREQVLRNHVDRTLDLAARVAAGTAPQPDAVIWPENSSDIDPLTDPDANAQITRAAQAIGAPILVGAVLDGPGDDKRRNAGIVWDPHTGPGATYLKRHPVPFAEYIPLRGIARHVSDKVDLVPRDMVAGHTPGVLRIGPLTVGDVICFEVAYDDLVRDTVTGGGQLLVVQTNNATFGRTGETYQQLAMSRIRAVEHGRTVVVAATSGVSAVITPDGHLHWTTDILTPAVHDQAVHTRHTHTLATRLGALPEWLLTTAALAALLTAATTTLTTRRSATTRTRPEGEVPA